MDGEKGGISKVNPFLEPFTLSVKCLSQLTNFSFEKFIMFYLSNLLHIIVSKKSELEQIMISEITSKKLLQSFKKVLLL